MSNPDDSPYPSLTEEQIAQVDRLLENGGGETYSEIASAIEYRVARPGLVSDRWTSELEAYLLRQIALGHARRVWNKDAEDHFYMATK